MPAKYVWKDAGETRLLNLPGAAGIMVDTDDQELKYIGNDGVVRRMKGSSDAAAREVKVFTASDTPASVAASTGQEEAMTFTGVLTSDIPIQVVPPSAHPAGICQGEVRISAANTIQVRFANTTAGALSPAAGSYTLVVLR